MLRSLDCTQTQARASLFFDGQLRARSRRLLQEHLQKCASCMASYRQLRELIKTSGELPGRPVRADLAIAVRSAVAQRRQSVLSTLAQSAEERGRVHWLRRRAGAIAAAAAVVIVASYGVGYWMGLDGASSKPGALLVLRDQPPPSGMKKLQSPGATAQLASFDPTRFERAALGLAHDVEWIDSVPAEGRLPLLTAQLEYFDLDTQAVKLISLARSRATATEVSSELTSLAQFVHGLAIKLSDETREPVWTELRDEVRRRRLLTRRSQQAPNERRVHYRSGDQQPVRMRAVVDEVGGRLGATDRGALVELMVLKECFVEGRLEASVRYLKSNPKGGILKLKGKMFGLPAGAVVVRTLSEAGLNDAARVVVMGVTHTETGTSSSGGSFRLSTKFGGTPEEMQELMNKLRERFELQIKLCPDEPPRHCTQHCTQRRSFAVDAFISSRRWTAGTTCSMNHRT